MSDAFERAAEAIAEADALFIGAGAGMGVDSGLPDFRGNEGFWRAYPPFQKLGLSFVDLANPAWFRDDPKLAWGFYGHRLNLYRATIPHGGFEILRRWGAQREGGAFVFTSNVDGQFQRAGFTDDDVMECHGSIHHFQCTSPCVDEIWDAGEVAVGDDFRAHELLPGCPHCEGVARPNILMFGDFSWIEARSAAQQRRMTQWLSAAHNPVVIELGAGTAVPSVRWMCETVARRGAALVRINPRESQGPSGTISVAEGALAALRAIDALL